MRFDLSNMTVCNEAPEVPTHRGLRYLTSRLHASDALIDLPNLEKENLHPNKTEEIAACSSIITYET
jgi:hypothetical protein